MAKRRRPDNTMAKRKRTNNDVQNNTQTTIDQATRTPLKTGVNSGVPEGLAVPPPLETPQKDNQSQYKNTYLCLSLLYFTIYIYMFRSEISHWLPSCDDLLYLIFVV